MELETIVAKHPKLAKSWEQLMEQMITEFDQGQRYPWENHDQSERVREFLRKLTPDDQAALWEIESADFWRIPGIQTAGFRIFDGTRRLLRPGEPEPDYLYVLVPRSQLESLEAKLLFLVVLFLYDCTDCCNAIKGIYVTEEDISFEAKLIYHS